MSKSSGPTSTSSPSCNPSPLTSASRSSLRRRKNGVLTLLDQHLWPLSPGLPRRPWSAAHGLGPSVFTIHAKKTRTNRASVSQTVASRGAPPLPARSLGPCRCCLRTIFARRIGCLREGEGSWAWTRRNLVCGSEGFRTGAERRWGWPSCGQLEPPSAEVPGFARPTRGIVPAGKTHSPSPSGLG